MNILLIYPEREKSEKGFWKLFQKQINSTKKIRRDLIEISIQLPITWERKMVDLNQQLLSSESIEWADYIILKADSNQKASAQKVINKCKLVGKKTIGIGDLFDEKSELQNEIDHLILDHAALDPFVFDVENSIPKKTYGLNFLKNSVKYSRDSLIKISHRLSDNIQAFSV
jgi:hypothetical protein